MAGRDTEDGDENGGLGSGRLLMVAVLALAVASTAVLVLADNTTWLRMGVLASLWAALLGVFLAAKFRKQVGERENEVADLQSVYELELEREVAARREYELEVEAEARKRVEEASHADLAELRTELRALRESLERLTGGEVLVERFALRAQSTRMRALADGQTRVVAADNPRRSISASQPVPRQVDAATELIAHAATQSAQAGGQRGATQAGGQRGAAQSVQAGGQQVRREAPRRETQRPGGYRPEPSRPQTPRDGAVADEPRREAPAVGVPPQARPNWPDQRHQQTPAPGRRPVPVRVQQAQARPPQARAAQPAVVPQPPPSQQKPPPPPPQQQATRVAEPVRPPVHREPPPPRPPSPPPDVERHAGWPPPSRSETSRPDFARPEPAAHHAVDRTR
ncbi:MAG TPA: DUF6779 domain-containing protein, partial [Pseudonocardiaceae bacterium]|nr:DUF6779 domain-containing protein [Pseudonocardiaceae bacterium]